MTRNEAEKIIDRLKNGCTFHRFEEPGVSEEYYKFLMRNNYRPMNETVDVIFEMDSRNVPAISMLVKVYKETLDKNISSSIAFNIDYCEVCNNEGFVMTTEIRRIENRRIKADLPYYIITNCPFCPIGMSKVYDGSKCKDKSEYVINPITKHFNEDMINQLRRENRAKQRRIQSGKKMTLDEIKQLISGFEKIGWKMPEVSDADDSDFEQKYYDEQDLPLPF